jgi:hypothetical protein
MGVHFRHGTDKGETYFSARDFELSIKNIETNSRKYTEMTILLQSREEALTFPILKNFAASCEGLQSLMLQSQNMENC